jgi:hypothetical protein
MRSKELETTLIIILGLIVLSLYFEQYRLLYLGLSIGFLSLLSPRIGKYLHLFWIALADKLGLVSSYIILTLIFVLILIPLSFLYKIFNKDPLQLKDRYQSYWHYREKKFEEKDFLNPF